MTGFVIVGEGMLELSHSAHSSAWRLRHGGDTLNTAIHLARYGERVRYLTALGDDPFSEELRAGWTCEGIDLSLTLTAPGALPGLYAIRTDTAGERTFSYWRGESAARRMFDLVETAGALAAAEQVDWLVFSLISLAILPETGRERLLRLAGRVRERGGQVAFDGNYRPRLWENAEIARGWRGRAIACCTIGLPTLEDEASLAGARTAQEVAAMWCELGAREVVVKLGADGCLLGDNTLVPPLERLSPVDTSGAGDAFNAGFLHARAGGASPAAAAVAGHRLAGWVVMRAGAVPPRDEQAIYAAG